MCDCCELRCRECFPGGAPSPDTLRAKQVERMRRRVAHWQANRPRLPEVPDFARLATSPGRLPPPEE